MIVEFLQIKPVEIQNAVNRLHTGRTKRVLSKTRGSARTFNVEIPPIHWDGKCTGSEQQVVKTRVNKEGRHSQAPEPHQKSPRESHERRKPIYDMGGEEIVLVFVHLMELAGNQFKGTFLKEFIDFFSCNLISLLIPLKSDCVLRKICVLFTS